MNIDEKVAEAKRSVETWRSEQIARIRAEGDAQALVMQQRARADLDAGVERALAVYRQALARIEDLRTGNAGESPEVRAHMTKAYDRMELSATEDYERTVEFLKNTYRTFLGIS